MSQEEASILESLAVDVEKLMPLKNLIVALVVGAFAIGGWVAGIQIKSINTDHDIQVLQKKSETFEKAIGRADRNIVKIGQKLGLDVETPRD